MNQIITWLAPDPWRSLIRTNISEILFRKDRKIRHIDISPSSPKPTSLSSSANKRRYHFFEQLIWLKGFTRSLVIPSQVRICNFSGYIPVPYTCAPCIYWFGQKVKNCHLLWDAMRLCLLPHQRIVWYLLGEGPHSNQLHFYHLVINTMTTTSVELLCTTLLSILETTYSSSK